MQHVRSRYGVLDGAFAGVVGGLFISLAAFTVFPLARLGTGWSFLNLVGATLDQGWARYEGFHWRATPYGLLILLLFCLSLGVLTTWASNRSFLWATITGVLVAAGFWWMASGTWLPLLNPALYREVPSELLAAGHLALGAFIGFYMDIRGRTVVLASRAHRAPQRRATRREVFA